MKHAAAQLLDAYGFMRDPSLWDRDLAGQIAAGLGIEVLGRSHWKVIDYLREHYLANATLPWEGNLCRELDLVDHCVHRLFGGPLEAWKIAGLPDPGEEAREPTWRIWSPPSTHESSTSPPGAWPRVPGRSGPGGGDPQGMDLRVGAGAWVIRPRSTVHIHQGCVYEPNGGRAPHRSRSLPGIHLVDRAPRPGRPR